VGVVGGLVQTCLAVVPRVVRLVLLAIVSRKEGKVLLREQPEGRDGMLLSGMLLSVGMLLSAVETLLREMEIKCKGRQPGCGEKSNLGKECAQLGLKAARCESQI